MERNEHFSNDTVLLMGEYASSALSPKSTGREMEETEKRQLRVGTKFPNVKCWAEKHQLGPTACTTL